MISGNKLLIMNELITASLGLCIGEDGAHYLYIVTLPNEINHLFPISKVYAEKISQDEFLKIIPINQIYEQSNSNLS